MKGLLKVKIIGITILLFSCSKVDEKICIGFSANLSGTGSDLGVSGMYGALQAIDEINEDGGIDGKLLYLNIKNDLANKDQALKVDQDLVNEGCPIIIGHMLSSVTEKVIPFINSSDYLMISPTISTELLSNLDDNFIRVMPSNVFQIQALSKLVNFNEIENFGILYDLNNKLFAEAFIDVIELKMNNKLVNEISYDSNTSYIEGVLEDVKNINVTTLLIIGSGEDVATIAQTFKRESLEIQVILPTWAFSESLIMKGGSAVNGYSGINFFDIDSKDQDFLDFKESLLNKYDTMPSFSSIMAYESVQIVAQAMKKTSYNDVKEIRKYILNSNEYYGLFGDLSINSFGDANRGIFLYTISNGKVIRINP